MACYRNDVSFSSRILKYIRAFICAPNQLRKQSKDIKTAEDVAAKCCMISNITIGIAIGGIGGYSPSTF